MDKNFYNKGKRQLQVDNNIRNPLIFYDKDEKIKINPIYIIEDHPNDKNRFAILRTTENGKYVRGDSLYFKLGGFEIYTEINNAIFVDLINKTVFIKEYQKVVEEITPVDPEKRQYIIMMKNINNDTDEYRWEAMEGRSTMYNFIVDNIEDLNIDPENSFVLTENVPYKDALTVYQFIQYLKNADLVEEDGLDIDEWLY